MYCHINKYVCEGPSLGCSFLPTNKVVHRLLCGNCDGNSSAPLYNMCISIYVMVLGLL